MGAYSVIQVRASRSVKGCGTSVQAITCSSFIISVNAWMSSSSNGRRTNRSVLMEMSGKVLIMRRSVTFENFEGLLNCPACSMKAPNRTTGPHSP